MPVSVGFRHRGCPDSRLSRRFAACLLRRGRESFSSRCVELGRLNYMDVTDVKRLEDAINETVASMGDFHSRHQRVQELCRQLDAVNAAIKNAPTDGAELQLLLAELVSVMRQAESLFRDLSSSATSVVVASRKSTKQIGKFIRQCPRNIQFNDSSRHGRHTERDVSDSRAGFVHRPRAWLTFGRYRLCRRHCIADEAINQSRRHAGQD